MYTKKMEEFLPEDNKQLLNNEIVFENKRKTKWNRDNSNANNEILVSK